MWTVLEPQLAIICANMPFFKTIIAAIAPGLGSTADRKYGRSSERTFDRLGQQSAIHGNYSMDPLDKKTHTVKVGNDFDSTEMINMDVTSANSDEEQRLASNPGPYGISVVQKFDVEYEKASIRKR